MNRAYRIPVLLPCAAMVLASCMGVDDQAVPSDQREAVREAVEAGSLYGFIISDYQANILSDGMVEEDEYHAAVSAQRECVLQEGTDVGDLVQSPSDGRWYFEIYGAERDGVADFAEAERAFDLCSQEYLDVVEIRFLDQGILQGDERESVLQEMTDCLVSSGLPVPDAGVYRSESDVLEAVEDGGRVMAARLDAIYGCLDDASPALREASPLN